MQETQGHWVWYWRGQTGGSLKGRNMGVADLVNRLGKNLVEGGKWAVGADRSKTQKLGCMIERMGNLFCVMDPFENLVKLMA
jgi:hypothetical protein